MTHKKLGRPTTSPKTVQIAVRFDPVTLSILDKYCVQRKVSRAEAVRVAVSRLAKKEE